MSADDILYEPVEKPAKEEATRDVILTNSSSGYNYKITIVTDKNFEEQFGEIYQGSGA